MLESASSILFVFIVAAIKVLGTGEERDITSEFCGESVFVQSAYKITANKLDSNQLYYKQIQWDPDLGPSLLMVLCYEYYLFCTILLWAFILYVTTIVMDVYRCMFGVILNTCSLYVVFFILSQHRKLESEQQYSIHANYVCHTYRSTRYG